MSNDDELTVSIVCDDPRNGVARSGAPRAATVARFTLLQDVESDEDSYIPPATAPGPGTLWSQVLDTSPNADDRPDITQHLIDDRPVSVREANRWPQGRVRLRWDLRCPLCPRRVELAERRLYRQLDDVASRGKSQVSLAELEV